MNLSIKSNINHTSKYVPKPYDTPKFLGIKWQIDVKHVPKYCLTSSVPEDMRFYQYTCIDEASREKPKIIQTDNGQEFTWN